MKLVKNIILAAFFCVCMDGFDFSVAPISAHNNSFGSVSIGGVQTSITHSSGTNQDFKDYSSTRGGVIFGLKRGFVLGDSKRILLNAWLDGRAGRENKNGLYGFSSGAQVGVRIFGGRLIGLLGGGFEMGNIATSIPNEQYNIYGGLARAEVFIDISRGYGISIGYTQGFSYRSKKIIGERFDVSSIMLTLSYYDFSI